MKRSTKVLRDTLKRYSVAYGVVILISIINIIVFWLYNIFAEPLIYSSIIGFVVVVILTLLSFFIGLKKASEREQLVSNESGVWAYDLNPETLAEEDYCAMLNKAVSKLSELDMKSDSERQEMVDYYTHWVHQIKTPISVMRLNLKSNDTEENRELLSELFRIERYVDMVLQYIRLDAKSNDLVIGKYSLDDIIRESIRKYASQFIASKVRLEYEGTDKEVITDRKWLSCIIEQILSNAIKYAPEGKVTIEVIGDAEVVIRDDGIGISVEDLPRIFEKGYTGNNGREGLNSSGLGLYLSKRAADKINVPIKVNSEPSKGTSFILDLSKSDILRD